jgi:archaellum component FlaF (FlaF/FlaG flagellin family)
MMNFYIYNKNTGKIKYKVDLSTPVDNYPVKQNEAIAEYNISREDMYHDLENNKPKIRPSLDISSSTTINITNSYVVENLPQNSEIYIDGEFLTTINDGTLELDFPLSGNYEVKFKLPFPWISKTVYVEVTE